MKSGILLVVFIGVCSGNGCLDDDDHNAFFPYPFSRIALDPHNKTLISSDKTQIIAPYNADLLEYNAIPSLTSGCSDVPPKCGKLSMNEIPRCIKMLADLKCGLPEIRITIEKRGVNGYPLPAPFKGYYAPVVTYSNDIFPISLWEKYKWNITLNMVHYTINICNTATINMMPAFRVVNNSYDLTTLEKLLLAKNTTIFDVRDKVNPQSLEKPLPVENIYSPILLGLAYQSPLDTRGIKVYNLTAYFRMFLPKK